MLKNIVVCFIMILSFNLSFGQVAVQQKMADNFFNAGDYESALGYYEKLFQTNSSPYFLTRMVDCYIALDQLEDAEKALKKTVKKTNNPVQLAQLGYVYERQQKNKQAEKYYELSFKHLRPKQYDVLGLARYYRDLGKNKLALKAYEYGVANVKNFNVFYFEMADIYGAEKQYAKQINLYLELIKTNKGYLRTIQSVMNRNWDLDEDNEQTEELFRQLLQRTQEDQSSTIYAEMLIWLYQQQDDFEGAWLQVKAIDKRTQQKGARAINYAQSAYQQERYLLTIEVTDYIFDVAINPDITRQATVLKLQSQYAVAISDASYTVDQWDSLAHDFSEGINQIEWVNAPVECVIDYANIYALELNDLSKAIGVVDSILIFQPNNQKVEALAKIQKGDYLLLEDNIWDAALLYGQAELAFKHDEIGDLAKLKKAKVSYYDGEFDWALAQLDVLKASTSKKTANDAMDLSLFIKDNIPYDSIYIPLAIYANAELRYDQGLYEESLDVLDSLFNMYASHNILNDALFLAYKNQFALGQFDPAIASLKEIIETYPTELRTDKAILELARLYDYQLNDTAEAMHWYELIILEYTGSIYGVEAKERYRILRGDNIQ